MAYATLVSLRQLLLPILKQDHYSSSLDKPQIERLHEHVILLQDFFDEFPEKTKHLEGRIRDTANEAEDVIECILYEQIHRSMAPKHRHIFQKQHEKLQKVIRNIKSTAKEVMKIKNSQHPATSSSMQLDDSSTQQAAIFEKLAKVIVDIESIVGEVMTIKNNHQLIDDSSPSASLSVLQLGDASAPRSSSMSVPTEKDSMVGFEADLLEIKYRLCGESSQLEVIPICGMGGIGKTTLARNAFEDPLSIEHFHIRAWATVSQKYNLLEILLTLLNSIKEVNEVFDEKKHKYELMAEQVYKKLKGRKYLIVLDDLWSMEAWDDVRRLFPNDNNGSRVILTTRILDVASYAASSTLLHEMHLMDETQSWELLRQKVFKQENCPLELERIGRLIATSCKGLPLAIVVIAGLLSTVTQTQTAWQNIADSLNFADIENSEQFTKLFSLSYSHLPHRLRACFLYMGAFPEDYEIYISKLVKLWVAEGFVKPSESNTLEESAEEYLEDLVRRSLVLVIKRKFNGKIKSCSLHDLIRDLCIRKAQEDKFLLHVGDRYVDETLVGSIKDQQCRLSVHDSSLALLSNIYAPGIRTVLFFYDGRELPGYQKNFKLAGVLDGVQLKFRKFPDEVIELIHLRHLAFTCKHKGDIFVPDSISRLQNLQTLFIYPKTDLIWKKDCAVFVPLEIWRMPQIRHLVLFLIDSLPDPCDGSSPLENLQTLVMVRNFKCTDKVVEMIPNLKKLGIIYNGKGFIWEDYHLYNLVHLNQLEKLKICLECFGLEQRFSWWGNVSLPVTLKKLNLSGFSFRPAHMAMFGSLPNLEVLKLHNCKFEESKWETSEGEFGNLKFMQIIGCTNLRHWITERDHFPILQHLMIGHCINLNEIPGVIGDIPTLELIEVNSWEKSLVESAQQIKQEQQSFGNDYLQVRTFLFSNTLYLP